MTLGERVLLERRRQRLTQAALGGHAGVNKMTIWRLEHGNIQDVKSQVLAKLALALDVSADYLLGLDATPQRQARDPYNPPGFPTAAPALLDGALADPSLSGLRRTSAGEG